MGTRACTCIRNIRMSARYRSCARVMKPRRGFSTSVLIILQRVVEGSDTAEISYIIGRQIKKNHRRNQAEINHIPGDKRPHTSVNSSLPPLVSCNNFRQPNPYTAIVRKPRRAIPFCNPRRGHPSLLPHFRLYVLPSFY